MRASDPFAVAAAEAQSGAGSAPVEGLTRRQMREQEEQQASRGGRDGGSGGRTPGSPKSPKAPKKKRRGLLALAIVVVTLLVVGGGGFAYAWTFHQDKVRELLGWQVPIDYPGTGNGTAVTVVIQSGDIGSDIARTLVDSKVTMTFDATYQYLIANPDITFEPGNYKLQEQMSAASAVAALQDPANKIINTVLIKEGMSIDQAFDQLSAGTGISVDDFTAAAADFASYGVSSDSPSVEGWLFPATYTFDPGVTAPEVIQQMVDKTISVLDANGVAPADRLKILKMAALVQREAGGTTDMPKIARVFYNRIDQGMLLQSDATVAYGTGNTHTVWTTPAERADPSNLYNTYVHEGLPYGPIGNPGEAAIKAAIAPADGLWLYFVPINLQSGETVFSETLAQHEAAVAQLKAWCKASPENATYCA
ncbi:MAG: endolytic transglycosylase MltG [Pseudolysinimonas sp.]|uniref:endolytic transglycosylase MltG n=1 Tax=Pseudolysinimonas sp. TaxID=2680009 RepID=UPI003264B41B